MIFEINEKIEEALKLIEEGKNVFITGRAGTGKSSLLKYFREKTDKNVVVLAPTGVAALNVNGQTIHSFFRFKPDITIEKVRKLKIKNTELYKNIDILIIDEISMVRADLFDCMHEFMKKFGRKKNKPFGGVQLVCFGDLYQLQPVVKKEESEIFEKEYNSPYFFSSKIFDELNMQFVELEKIYRQEDQEFIEVLNRIRNNTVEDKDIKYLNKRFKPDFEPSKNDSYIYLVTTNKKAEEINNKRLNELKGREYKYLGIIEGEFKNIQEKKENLPCPEEIVLKKGAQVMLVNNDSKGRWINGSVGKVVNVEEDDDNDIIIVELTNKNIVEVNRVKWELFRYYYNEKEKKIDTETIGTYIQYPIILAWAITIHKSQGKTFEKIIIDIGSGIFAPGQFYVAISRCTSIDGVILKTKVSKGHIFNDKKIVKFITGYQYKLADKKMGTDEKMELIKNAIKNKKKIEITYLKKTDEKSKRILEPYEVGELEYDGHKFLGVSGLDSKSKEVRNFKLDRILDIEII